MLTVVGVNDPANAVRYQIDTPSASAATDGPGEYRVALMNGRGALETELAVFRGYATLATDVGSTAVRAGERTLARDDLAPSQPLPFNSARFDAFDRWASARRDARAGTTSTRYLPRDLYAYSSTFDSNGTWGYEAPYGNVWYPTVAPGWRPYSNGYWSSVPSVRLDLDWVRRVGMANASLRPLGIRRPVVLGSRIDTGARPGSRGRPRRGMSAGVRSATAEAGGFSLGVSFGNPWGWVVVSRPYFGYRYPVHHHALPPTAIPYRTPFVVQARAPLAPPAAVPRPRAIPRPPAGGPGPSQRAQSAPGRQPATVPGVASAVAPNQPELGGARARSGGRPSATVSAPAGARTRSTFASPPATNDNRYVPDTRTLGGRPPAAIPRRATPAPPASTDSATGASPRWYPPVTMTRPRTEQQPTVAPQPSPGYRTAPVPRAQPSMAPPSGAPGGAQPRRPAGAPPVSAFQPPQVNSPPASPRGSVGVPPASAQMPRGPVAVPRAGPQPGAAPQAAPAQPASPSQPASPPAGARSPRSR